MVMTIRPVVPGDLPALRELFLQSRLATFTWELSSSLALGDFDSQTAGEWQLVALDGGRPVGFISVWEPTHFIHHLHVHPQFARRGIGQALLRALPGWSTTRYQLKCVRLNATALASLPREPVRTGRRRQRWRARLPAARSPLPG